MPECSKCGGHIRIGEDEIHTGERDLFYHISCAPDDLLKDAETEGNAILARGVTYYVNKYLPNELRARTWPKKTKGTPSDEELAVYADLFAKIVKSYRSERARRKKV